MKSGKISAALNLCVLLLFIFTSSYAWSMVEDSLYLSLVKSCAEKGIIHAVDSKLSEQKTKLFVTQAKRMGYTSSEARAIVSKFEREKVPVLVDTFIYYICSSSVTKEDWEWTLQYFENEKGREVLKHFDYYASDEFSDRMKERLISSVSELLVERKVVKENCSAPKDFQKKASRYFDVYGGNDNAMNVVVEHLSAITSEKMFPLVDEYLRKNLFSVLCDMSYGHLLSSDFQYMNDFFASPVGGRVWSVKEWLSEEGEDAFDEVLDESFEAFLQEYYQVAPPATLQVAPLENDERNGAHG